MQLWYVQYLDSNAGVENRRFRSNGVSLTQNLRQKGVAPNDHSSSQKTKINDPSYGIKIWAKLSSVLSQSTRLTDRRTNGWTDKTDSFLVARPRCMQCMQRSKSYSQYKQVNQHCVNIDRYSTIILAENWRSRLNDDAANMSSVHDRPLKRFEKVTEKIIEPVSLHATPSKCMPPLL